jgi:hypothetical protein
MFKKTHKKKHFDSSLFLVSSVRELVFDICPWFPTCMTMVGVVFCEERQMSVREDYNTVTVSHLKSGRRAREA